MGGMRGDEARERKENILDRRMCLCQGSDLTPSYQTQVPLPIFLQWLPSFLEFSKPCCGPSSTGGTNMG